MPETRYSNTACYPADAGADEKAWREKLAFAHLMAAIGKELVQGGVFRVEVRTRRRPFDSVIPGGRQLACVDFIATIEKQ
jgi:hypothetical protein